MPSNSICPSCGWNEPAGFSKCSQCGRNFDGSLTVQPALEQWNTFSLKALFVAISLVSIWMAVTVRLPWLGAVLGVLCFPALLRAWASGRLARFQQETWGWNDWFYAFLKSLLLIWVIAVISLAVCIILFPMISIALDSLSTPDSAKVFILLFVAVTCSLGFCLVILKLTWPSLPKKKES